MASHSITTTSTHYSIALLIGVLSALNYACLASKDEIYGLKVNAIDRCWRWDSHWRRNRQQLAMCSVGFAGQMTENVGKDLIHYEVIDPSDNPLNPKEGTLRFGATMIKGKVWITFKRDMRIRLEKPLLISSFTTIDGRGAIVHIAGNACLTVYKESNIIIHGLRIHHCKSQEPSQVMGTNSEIMQLGQVDGDAIRLITASNIWIDHNTLYKCQDGLLDVTRGSTDITISNNWFRNQDKVMLLGHDDGYLRDRNMRVTVVYNHFGPNCGQRMPRIRHGYAHVVNNFYQGWHQYAIGGSMNPSFKSEANLFIAPKSGSKEITWSTGSHESSAMTFNSVRDSFKNGAFFRQKGLVQQGVKPEYNPQQWFKVADANSVRALTSSSGAFRCARQSRC